MHHTTWVVGWSGYFRLLAWTVEAVGKSGEGRGEGGRRETVRNSRGVEGE